jgi:hypothetical protein
MHAPELAQGVALGDGIRPRPIPHGSLVFPILTAFLMSDFLQSTFPYQINVAPDISPPLSS